MMLHEPPVWTPDLLDAPHDAPDKAGRVRRMFNRIAPRYELVNTILSAGRDAAWRRRAVALAGVSHDDRVLDIGCGTGDFARTFAAAGVHTVVGCDFAHEMLVLAARRGTRGVSVAAGSDVGAEHARACGLGMAPDEHAPASRERDPHPCPSPLEGEGSSREPSETVAAGPQVQAEHARASGLGVASDRCRDKPLHCCDADALHLPFPAESFSIASCAFSVRNFADLDGGLAEMHRVLQRGGRAVILEFTRPRHRLARFIYELYFHHVMPGAATLISGDRSGAYRYLPRSVVTFVQPEEMGVRLGRAGFAQVTARPLTMGIVTVFVATRE